MCTITVYTTGPTCMQCTMTKKAMTAAGLDFTEVDLRREPAAMEYVQEELQYSQAPVVVVSDEDHWSGFQPAQIQRVAAVNQSGHGQ